MKIINLVLVLICITLLGITAFKAYAAYQVSYTDMETENFAGFRQGNMKLAINFTLLNAEGDSTGRSEVFDLSKAEQTQVLNFLKPYILQIATKYDVNPDAWAVAGDKLSVSPASIDFGTEKTELEFTITNTGAVELDWIATPDHVCIACDPASGTLDGGATKTVVVTLDRTGLPSGSYTKNIAITSDSGNANVTVNGDVP